MENPMESGSEETKEGRSSASKPKSKKLPLIAFNRKNYLLHFYFIRRDFNACKALIKETLDDCKELCDYPMYIRGKIAQIEGELDKALFWYENATALNPRNALYLCRIGQVYFLLGNHSKAIEVLLNAIEKNPKLKQAYFWRAMSLYYSERNEESIRKAQECLLALRNVGLSIDVLKFMAALFKKKNEGTNAAQVYEQIIKLEPDNVDALTNLGLIYYKENHENKAFEMFGRALSYDPFNSNAIIAAGSIIQTNGDFDVALAKYRIAAESCDYNGSLWNNIGMCFFGKGKHIAAISCLKKANYLCPLDWKISYNLGLVHYSIKQYASAYHFLSAAINLNPFYAMAYATIAAVLMCLNDASNARKAYDKAVQLDKQNPQILFNYAVFEFKQKQKENAIKLARQCEEYIHWNHPRKKEFTAHLDNLKQALQYGILSSADGENSYI